MLLRLILGATLADDVKQTFKITFKRTIKWNLEKHKYKTKKKFKGYTDLNALLITFYGTFCNFNSDYRICS